VGWRISNCTGIGLLEGPFLESQQTRASSHLKEVDQETNTVRLKKAKKEKKGKSAQPSRLVFSQGTRTRLFFS
jgi:hypothetical protein